MYLSLTLLLILLLVLAAAIFYRDVIIDGIAMIMWLRARDRVGGAQRQKYFYHGTDRTVDVFEPRPSRVIDNELAVFATSSYADAVVFSAQWTDYDFVFGSVNGERFLIENYPDALEKLNRNGYIHYLPPKSFTHDRRLGLSNEYISRESVAALKCDVVNIAKYLATSAIKVIKFTENLAKTDAIDTDLQHKVSALYILTDPYWTVPEQFIEKLERGGDKTIFFYNEEGDKVLNEKLRKLGRAEKCILIGDPADLWAGKMKFGFVRERYLLEPHVLVGPKSKKTSAAEYARFIAARRRLFEGVPVVYGD